MQAVSVPPRIVIDGLFVLGLALMIGYAFEFVYCKSSNRPVKRVFNVLVWIWFTVLGLYVFFALSYWIGILAVVGGAFLFYWDKRIAGRLLLK